MANTSVAWKRAEIFAATFIVGVSAMLIILGSVFGVVYAVVWTASTFGPLAATGVGTLIIALIVSLAFASLCEVEE